MNFLADLHLHSSYSRATSRQLTLEHLHAWGQLKGIQVVGSGDCLHPAWSAECRKKFHDEGNGLFSLKKEFAQTTQELVPAPCSGTVRFMLTVEISSIYKKGGRVRKVHNVVCLPSFAAADRIITRLERIGNLKSDGRPILGLDSRDLLEIALEADPKTILIPAHIWTPWFSALGSKSGFDSIEACYGDLTKYIYAVETGLSSDPPMNWRLSGLDPFALVSFSDAHSPSKLGRECTRFSTDLSYDAIFRALSDKNDAGLAGTIEFFPEEGKYHVDGHRKCNVRFSPEETIAHKGACPVCGKPLTVGVLSRVEELADRKAGEKAPRGRPFKSLVPLCEIIAESLDCGPETKAAVSIYQSLVSNIGNEFAVLLDADVSDIAAVAGDLVAEGIRRMRSGEVTIAAGYDGEFGTVTLFTDAERSAIAGQTDLFGAPQAKIMKKKRKPADAPAHKKKAQNAAEATTGQAAGHADPLFAHVNEAQKKAIVYNGNHLLIVAGPGTGKTHTLTRRIAHVSQRLARGQRCLAVTFTNKAAAEMKERLEAFGADTASKVFTGTIHAFCLTLLRAHAAAAGLPASFEIASPENIDSVARQAWPDAGAAEKKALLETVSRTKSQAPGKLPCPDSIRCYDAALFSRNMVDFDTILHKCHELLSGRPEILAAEQKRYPFIFVDEYQDINGVQHAIVRLLAGPTGSVTAIGDPHQSIYGFRGADVSFFASFAVDFPGAQLLALTENYRTAPCIVKAFGQVIRRSTGFETPPVVAALERQGRLTVYTAPSGPAEAEYVVRAIEKLVGGTSMFSHDSGRVAPGHEKELSFREIAVLYRTNSLRRDLEEALSRSGVPFTVSGEKPFYARADVASLLGLLRFSAGEGLTEEALGNLLERTVPHFSGKSRAVLFSRTADPSGNIDKSILAGLLSSTEPLAPPLQRSLTPFLAMVQKAGDLLAAPDLPQAVSLFTSLPAVKNDFAASPEAKAIMERLLRIARAASSYRGFMDEVLLQREDDPLASGAEAVALMTLHASKGLEWPVVFIIGCEAGAIPLARETGIVDTEEERRLFYVGMSRAKEQLYLTSAAQRAGFGEKRSCRPSPFLADIEENLKDYDLPRSKQYKKDAEQLSLF
jgi:DNA helicase II / ATP-dependent DNA helicase PcrA